MDPNAALELVAIYIQEHDLIEAKYAARDLVEWIRKGGFEPDWTKHPIATRYIKRHFPN